MWLQGPRAPVGPLGVESQAVGRSLEAAQAPGVLSTLSGALEPLRSAEHGLVVTVLKAEPGYGARALHWTFHAQRHP